MMFTAAGAGSHAPAKGGEGLSQPTAREIERRRSTLTRLARANHRGGVWDVHSSVQSRGCTTDACTHTVALVLSFKMLFGVV